MKPERAQKEQEFFSIAQEILEAVGGRENVISVSNCITRLRLSVRDMEHLDEEKIKEAGAAAVLRLPENKVHIVLGPRVLSIAREFQRLWKA